MRILCSREPERPPSAIDKKRYLWRIISSIQALHYQPLYAHRARLDVDEEQGQSGCGAMRPGAEPSSSNEKYKCRRATV